MSVFIGIEDLAANALISLINHGKSAEVSIEDLSNYGTKVVELLTARGEIAVLLYSKDITNALERNYSDYFEMFVREQKQFIKMKDGISTKDIIRRYRSFLSINLVYAFTSKESLAFLGV